MTDQKSFYTGIARCKHNISVITDDKEQLSQNLTERSGTKVQALEAKGLQKSAESQSSQRDMPPPKDLVREKPVDSRGIGR